MTFGRQKGVMNLFTLDYKLIYVYLHQALRIMKQEFTPQQSFDLINRIIDERKITYEENGHTILLWGITVMFAGIGQYIIMNTQWAVQSWGIWFVTMIPMFFYTVYVNYKRRKEFMSEESKNNPWDVSGMTWMAAGIMALLNGFILHDQFGNGFTTVMYLPFCIAALVTALSIKKKRFVILVILAAITAYMSLFIPFVYHSLVSALIAFLLFFIPGLMLRSDFKKREHV